MDLLIYYKAAPSTSLFFFFFFFRVVLCFSLLLLCVFFLRVLQSVWGLPQRGPTNTEVPFGPCSTSQGFLPKEVCACLSVEGVAAFSVPYSSSLGPFKRHLLGSIWDDVQGQTSGLGTPPEFTRLGEMVGANRMRSLAVWARLQSGSLSLSDAGRGSVRLPLGSDERRRVGSYLPADEHRRL